MYLVRFDESSKESEKGIGVRLTFAEVFDAFVEGVLGRFGLGAQPAQLLLGVAQKILEDHVLLVVFEVLAQFELLARQLHALVQFLHVRHYILQRYCNRVQHVSIEFLSILLIIFRVR